MVVVNSYIVHSAGFLINKTAHIFVLGCECWLYLLLAATISAVSLDSDIIPRGSVKVVIIIFIVIRS